MVKVGHAGIANSIECSWWLFISTAEAQAPIDMARLLACLRISLGDGQQLHLIARKWWTD